MAERCSTAQEAGGMMQEGRQRLCAALPKIIQIPRAYVARGGNAFHALRRPR